MIVENIENKKEKDTKKCVIKRKFKLKVYKTRLEVTHLESEINHLGKSERNQ